MRGSAAFRSAIAPGGVLAGPWVQNELWRRARAKPSLDLRLAERKSLVDATTGQNLVSFTRASSGTYVDSQGVIRTATTNLLLRSEEFDNASWSKGGLLAFGSGSFTNAITAPTGTVTADLLTEDTSTGQHRVWQTASNTVNTNVHTVSFYAKAKERTRIYVGIAESPSFSRQGNATFNLANGTVVSFASGNNGATGGTASIVDAGNGWYRCSYSLVLGGTNTAIFCDLNIVSAGTTISYTGDGTSGIYLWGAQLEQSSTVGEYIPTTSTINSAPRFDHAITSSVTNFCLNSADLAALSWTPNNVSISTNTQTAPDNTLTADTLTTTGGTASLHAQIPCLASTTYTWSFYVKLGTMPASDFRFAVRDDSNVAFIATDIVPNITPVTNEWRRVTYTFTTPAGCVLVRPYLYRYAFTTGGTIHLWGAQLEQSSTVGAYVPTTTAAATSSTTESLGLLVEESRTNSIRNNTMVGAVAGTPGTAPTNWVIAQNGITGVSFSVIGTGVQNGISYIDIRAFGIPSATVTQAIQIGFESSTAASASASQTWTNSAWVQIVGGSSTNITEFTLNTQQYNAGVFVRENTVQFTPNTSTFSRYSGTVTFSAATTTAARPLLAFGTTASAAIDITLRIGLPQLEQGAFATSVIPTSTAAATRSADVASISGSNFSSWYRQDEGTVFAEYLLPNLLAGTVASFDDGTANNRWQMRYTTAPDAGRYRFVSASGSFDYTSQTALPIANRMSKSAYVARSTDQQWATNAVISSIAGSQATMPTVDRLQIGNGAASDQAKQLTIRRLTYWPQRLSNSALQSITQ